LHRRRWLEKPGNESFFADGTSPEMPRRVPNTRFSDFATDMTLLSLISRFAI
jgi:hypothetical protein